MTELDEVRAEILRLRDAVHAIRSEVDGLRFEVRELEKWRERLDPIVDGLREADRIAEAVARIMTEQAQKVTTNVGLGLTKRQTWAAISAALIAAMALVLNLLAQLGVIG